MTKNFTNTNDQWLIKSAGRILGPFKLTEVVSGLQLKHFTVMDEISVPYGRWNLIRDEAVLQEILKTLRKIDDGSESTMTMTATATVANVRGMDPRQMTNNGQMPSFPFDSKRDLLQEQQLRASMKKRAMVMKTVVGVLLLVILGLGFFIVKKSKMGGGSYDELALQLSSLKNQGLYEKTLDLLNRAKLTDKNNPDLETEMAMIQVGFYGQTVIPRRALEKSGGSFEDATNGASVSTAIALTYMLEGDWKNAGDQLQKALVKSPGYGPALFNKAIISFKIGQFESSEKEFEDVIPKNLNDGDVILSSTLSSLEVARKGMMPVRILPVLNQMLDEYLRNNFAYEQELLVLQAYIYNQLNKQNESLQYIQKLLNSDLESGKNHKVELLFDRSLAQWKNLISYCQTVYESAPSDVLYKTLWAYCNYRNGNDMESKKIIEEASLNQPTNPQVQYLKSFLMFQMGQNAIAKASLNVTFADSNMKGNLILKGKICEKENNDACALESYTQAIEKDPRLVSAYVGLAKIENKKSNKKGATDWITRGLSVANSYVPLWELKYSMGK